MLILPSLTPVTITPITLIATPTPTPVSSPTPTEIPTPTPPQLVIALPTMPLIQESPSQSLPGGNNAPTPNQCMAWTSYLLPASNIELKNITSSNDQRNHKMVFSKIYNGEFGYAFVRSFVLIVPVDTQTVAVIDSIDGKVEQLAQTQSKDIIDCNEAY